MKTLNGVIVGAGNFANFPLQRFTTVEKAKYGQDLSDQVGDIYITDVSQAVLDAKGEKFGIPEEKRILLKQGQQLDDKLDLDKIDFAFVCTPATMHYDTTAPLIVKKIPTFLSKPVDADYGKALKLIELAELHETPNAAGSQMLFHPALVKAIEYIKDNQILITHASIHWTKERGPREHVIPGITVEEGPHPFGILASLIPGLPYRVNAIDRTGEITINPENWKNTVNKKGTKFAGQTDMNNANYIVGEISKVSMTTLKYKDGQIAEVYNDFDNPRKARTVEIIGVLPQGERYQKGVTIHVDLTDLKDKYKENAPHITNKTQAWQGCLDKGPKERSGLGKLVLDDKFNGTDDFGQQFAAFLDWARTGKKPASIMTFFDQMRSEKMIDAANRSIEKDAEVRYNGEEYI